MIRKLVFCSNISSTHNTSVVQTWYRVWNYIIAFPARLTWNLHRHDSIFSRGWHNVRHLILALRATWMKICHVMCCHCSFSVFLPLASVSIVSLAGNVLSLLKCSLSLTFFLKLVLFRVRNNLWAGPRDVLHYKLIHLAKGCGSL
jgi:hypothetical protein